ncbi:MAG: Dyp-type peroxidase, partial [Actinomycetota bacterium]|nr:Dyp-type peroxidase [Actinomycetota bacterium]
LDLTPAVTGPAALRTALRQLSAAARAAMAGNWPSVSAELAAGLQPAGLTVTIGLGASALGTAGLPVPDQLRPLPAFGTDHLQAARSGGDLGIQLCADDPMAVGAAVRALLGSLAGLATLRWSQGGFLRGAAAVDPAATPRNLMGQLDGTDNPTGARRDLAVWVPAGVSPSWMAGGSYLVCRRIRMLLDSWERLGVAAQEAAVGRRKDTGAPLTGQQEHDNPDFAAEQAGRPVIAANAHLRLTHPANNSGASMLRRGYSYDDGVDATGSPDSGLFFQAFQTDPHQVFVPIQRKLAASDALGSFLRHEASALFAMPPGASPGGFVGERLF